MLKIFKTCLTSFLMTHLLSGIRFILNSTTNLTFSLILLSSVFTLDTLCIISQICIECKGGWKSRWNELKSNLKPHFLLRLYCKFSLFQVVRSFISLFQIMKISKIYQRMAFLVFNLTILLHISKILLPFKILLI
jgi:hypothetical protein